jgi:hypothetical protein
MISGILRYEEDSILLDRKQIIYIAQESQGGRLLVLTPTELFYAGNDEEARQVARWYNRDRVQGRALPLPVYWYWMKTLPYRLKERGELRPNSPS